MSKTALQQIEDLRKETEAKIESLKQQALAELQKQLDAAQAEVERIQGEISELTGGTAGAATAAKRTRLPALEEGSQEWEKIASQIRTVLKNYPEGLNGKTIAYKMGKTELKEVRRIITVVQATCRREGEGVQTRFFLK
jgi:predicted nuclease with TOPRIM domain